MLLKKRSKIEHTNNILKKNKTINIRYEKYSINYKNFVQLAIIKLCFSKIGDIQKYIYLKDKIYIIKKIRIQLISLFKTYKNRDIFFNFYFAF